MPSAPAPFVSFNDYLDANAGSLQQERGGMISGAQGAVDKASADLSKLGDSAEQFGSDQAAADWNAQADGAAGGITSSEQYKPQQSTFSLDAGQMSGLKGYEDFTKDREAASQAVNTLSAGGLGQGKTAFEAGLLGADTGFQSQVAGVSKQYGDTINNYLDTLNARGQKGYNAFAPAPIQGTKSLPPTEQNLPGTTNMGPQTEGPMALKPGKATTVKTINGVPQGGGGEPQLPAPKAPKPNKALMPPDMNPMYPGTNEELQ